MKPGTLLRSCLNWNVEHNSCIRIFRTITPATEDDSNDYVEIVEGPSKIGARPAKRNDDAVPKIAETPEVKTPRISTIEMGTKPLVKALTSNIPSKKRMVISEQPLYVVQGARSRSYANIDVSKRKRDSMEESHSEDEAYDTEEERQKKHPTQGLKRSKRKSVSQRRSVLENEDHISQVEEYRVRCKECQKWVTLNPKCTYELHNWTRHKQKCPRITGTQIKRMGVIKKARLNDPVSIDGCFKTELTDPKA